MQKSKMLKVGFEPFSPMALRTCVLPKRLVGDARRTVKQIHTIYFLVF